MAGGETGSNELLATELRRLQLASRIRIQELSAIAHRHVQFLGSPIPDEFDIDLLVGRSHFNQPVELSMHRNGLAIPLENNVIGLDPGGVGRGTGLYAGNPGTIKIGKVHLLSNVLVNRRRAHSQVTSNDAAFVDQLPIYKLGRCARHRETDSLKTLAKVSCLTGRQMLQKPQPLLQAA